MRRGLKSKQHLTQSRNQCVDSGCPRKYRIKPVFVSDNLICFSLDLDSVNMSLRLTKGHKIDL